MPDSNAVTFKNLTEKTKSFEQKETKGIGSHLVSGFFFPVKSHQTENERLAKHRMIARSGAKKEGVLPLYANATASQSQEYWRRIASDGYKEIWIDRQLKR